MRIVPGRFCPQLAKRRQLRADAVESRVQSAQQPLTCLRWCDVPGRPGEEAHAQPRFQPPDRVAQRRLRGPELRRCARKALLLSHHHEGIEIDEFLALHS